jgi:diguanylate cyclase (GGDEF)-like protein
MTAPDVTAFSGRRFDPRDLAVWGFIVLLAAAAGAAQLQLLRQPDLSTEGPAVPWPLLFLAFVAAERFVVHVHFGREVHSFAPAEIPLVVGLFLVSPTELVTAQILGLLVVLVWHQRQTAVKLAFNLVQKWLIAVSVVLGWRLLLGDGTAYSLRGWVAAVVAIALADLLQGVCVAMVIAIRRVSWSWDFVCAGLWVGLAGSMANASFGLLTLNVLVTDWRRAWALVLVAGVLVAAHRAHISLQKSHDSLASLNAVTREIGTELELDAVLGGVLQRVRELLQAERADLTLEPSFAGRPMRFTGDDAGLHRSAAGEQPQRSGNSADALEVELYGEQGPIGRLRVSDRLGDVGGFGREEQQLLEALAGHAAVALHNGRLADQLRGQVRENAYQAFHDRLTGLPNRLAFDVSVDAALATGEPVAVLVMDLDRFKDVNDTLGHAAGDELLQRVGGRLRASLPEECSVARLGGDEFAVVLPGADEAGATAYAEVLRAALLRPFRLAGIALSVDASVGIALSPRHGDDVQTLMRRADVAMYVAKDAGIGVSVYSLDRDHNSADRLALASDLRRALEDDAFRLVYQPKTNLADGHVGGVEALIRWTHPTRGFVSPEDFIPVAEQTGLIGALTEWVLRTALDQCSVWSAGGRQLGIAVNVSPRNLHDSEFPPWLGRLLAETGVDPRLLTLEITEGAVMADPERAIGVLGMLRDLGVRLSVDDLGVGHSSLAYLRRLPVHEVKIDKSFVLGMADDPDDQAIARALVELGHTLRMTVVAEGVEDESTWHLLREMSCDKAQGFWMARPLEPEQLEPWFVAWEGRRQRLRGLAGALAG